MDPRQTIVELCRQFYTQGWVSGTGGGISIRDGDKVWMAPSGVQKERLQPEDLFTVDLEGCVLTSPGEGRTLSACAPLFLSAMRQRDAGAVIHSHSINAMLATLTVGAPNPSTGFAELHITHLEMMKGLRGHGYHDTAIVPVLPNTAHEADLADSMSAAIDAYPNTFAVLVQRHGLYVWGRDWVEAKTHAECYDYLFEAVVRMKAMGIDASVVPESSGETGALGAATGSAQSAAE